MKTQIQWSVFERPGMSWLRGYFKSEFSFEETVARLVTLTGKQPMTGDETSFDFEGFIGDRYFTIYDYLRDGQFHIGGTDGLDTDALGHALREALRSVEPTNYIAYYDGGGFHSYTRS